MFTRRLASALGLALIGGGVLVVASVPAAATGTECAVVSHTDLGAVAQKGDVEATLTGTGVRVKLGDASAKATALFPTSTPLKDVTAFSYQTQKYDSATAGLPSGQLVLDYNGDAADGFTTLVHEGVYQDGASITGTKSWSAVGQKWWSTRVIPGQPNVGVLLTLAQVVEHNPDAVVQQFGVSVGSGSPGTDVRWNYLKFKTADACAEHRWAKPKPTSPTPPPTTPPATPTAGPADPGVPPAGDDDGDEGTGGSLPVTGLSVPEVAGLSAVLLLTGLGLFLLARSRRTRFTA